MSLTDRSWHFVICAFLSEVTLKLAITAFFLQRTGWRPRGDPRLGRQLRCRASGAIDDRPYPQVRGTAKSRKKEPPARRFRRAHPEPYEYSDKI